jgi:hypothetical protein
MSDQEQGVFPRNVYFEHTVISSVVRKPPEAEAAWEILELHRDGALCVWASRVSEEEIGRCEVERTRVGLEEVYRLLQQVAFVETQRLCGFNRLEDPRWGTTSVSPMIEDHPWLARVRPLRLTLQDEHHLLLARGATAPPMDVFISLDLGAYFNDGAGEGKRRVWIRNEPRPPRAPTYRVPGGVPG